MADDIPHPDTMIEASGMTNAAGGAGHRRVAEWTGVILRGRLPFLITFGCMLLVNWGAAVWVLNYTYEEREKSAFQLVNDEARYSEQKIVNLFKDADRTLLDLRTRYAGDALRSELEHWPRSGTSPDVALIAPDGTIVASTPHANTSGWPNLMARLAASADVMTIGEPVLGKAGLLSFVPVARRVTGPEGSFDGILMFSVRGDAFPDLSPAVAALDGCGSLITDDGMILVRNPDVRGTAGIRVPAFPSGRMGQSGSARRPSLLDGVDRIFAWRRLDGIPAIFMVGIGYDATFASWETVRLTVICTRLAASVLILLAAWFWYTRRRQATLSTDALTTILSSIDRGIRVETADGAVVAANAAGETLRIPDDAFGRAETRRPDGTIVQIERHDTAGGGVILIGTDITERLAAEARLEFLTNHDPLTGTAQSLAGDLTHSGT
jgi:PAS domain-containing protein